jgi:hypothetical protein
VFSPHPGWKSDSGGFVHCEGGCPGELRPHRIQAVDFSDLNGFHPLAADSLQSGDFK